MVPRSTAAMSAPLLAVVLMGLASSRARAEAGAGENDEEPVAPVTGQRSAAAGSFLPFTITPRKDAQRALVTTSGGYDGGRSRLSFESAAEVQVFGPVVFRGGAVYSQTSSELRPVIGMAAQVLRQERHGVDGALTVNYRAQGFNMVPAIETSVALGRRFEQVSLFFNAGGGIGLGDGERYGDVRMAALRRVGSRLHVGLDARLQADLEFESPEPAGEAGLEFRAAPVANLALGRFVLSGYGGVTAITFRSPAERARTGLVTGLGVGAVF
jgi:hypothetical protein